MTEYTQPPAGSSVGHSVAAAMSHLHAEKYRRQLIDRAVSNTFGGVPRAYLVVDPQTYDYLNTRALPEETWGLPEDKDKPFKFMPQFDYGVQVIRSPFLYTADIGGSVPVVEPENPSAFLTADLPERLPPEVLNDDKNTLVILGVVALLILLLGVAV
jgi:hypothetical protein